MEESKNIFLDHARPPEKVVHYFTSASKEAGNWPFAQELKRLGADYKIIAGNVPLRYQRRIWLVLARWPHAIYFAWWAAIISSRSAPKPDVIFVENHFQVLCTHFLFHKILNRHTPIILCSFIFTPRRSELLTYLRKQYFRHIISDCESVIVHSTLEETKYNLIFKKSAGKFKYIPIGIGYSNPYDTLDATSDDLEETYVFSAGRSGRDYATLLAAIEDTPFRCEIVCDSLTALPNESLPANVTAHRDCYGADYLQRLRASSLVVIPLSDKEISAGQMVLLHAMAAGRPVIVTETDATKDYVTHGRDCHFVPRRDVRALRAAIFMLMADKKVRDNLGKNAKKKYRSTYTAEAYAQRIHNFVSLMRS